MGERDWDDLERLACGQQALAQGDEVLFVSADDASDDEEDLAYGGSGSAVVRDLAAVPGLSDGERSLQDEREPSAHWGRCLGSPTPAVLTTVAHLEIQG